MNDTTATAPEQAAQVPDLSPAQRRQNTELMVRGIAWASIAIGVAELLAPRKTRRAVSVGIAGWWMRLRGLRSIVGGVALLVSDDTTRWLHRRSLGNALDVLTLARDNDGAPGERARNGAAMVAIGGLTAIDMTAAAMTESQARIAAQAPDQAPLNRG